MMLNLFTFNYISAEITLAVLSFMLVLVGLIVDIFKKESKVHLVFAMAILALCAYILLYKQNGELIIGFNNLFISHRYIIFAKLVVLISASASILFAMGYGSINKFCLKPEYPILILFSVLGMMVMLSANDFMSLYVGLELQSLCLYILTSFNKDDSKSSEAAMKYFILGAIATGLILYGVSLIYGFSGTTNFSVIHDLYHSSTGVQQIPLAVLIGIILTIAGLCFKIAAVPFHMWAPDVYQGAPLPVTAFLATTPKAAALLLIAKLLLSTFNVWIDAWQQVLKVIAVLSLLVGALGALRQNDIKRLLAYSSIGHIGFMLIGLISYSIPGLQSTLIYICIYITMNIGIFAFISMLQKPSEENFSISIFKGLNKRSPIMAFCIAVLLLSLAGIPPLAGFFAKFYVLNAAIAEELYVLATLGLITAVISTFYYLKIIKFMYFEDITLKTPALTTSYTIENILIASSATTFNLIFILFPSSLYGITSHIAQVLFHNT